MSNPFAAINLLAMPNFPSLPAADGRFDPALRGTLVIDIPYGIVLEQKLDLRFPSTDGPWPLVVYIHGGGWAKGGKGEAETFRFLADRGLAVASINYRLYPLNTFPAMIEDAKLAVRFLRSKAVKYNLKADRFAAMGFSSGGHLAELLAVADEGAGWEIGAFRNVGSEVGAAVAISAPADLADERNTDRMKTEEAKIFGGKGDRMDRLRSASPVSRVRENAPPFLLIHGDADAAVPMFHARAMEEALTSKGVPVETLIVEGVGHDLELLAAASKDRIVSFLSERLEA